jgi:hypothetical protein
MEPLLQPPSAGKPNFRTVGCCLIIIVLIGGALAWRSSDDGTRDTVQKWEISLIPSTSVLHTNSPSSSDVTAVHVSKSSNQALIAGSGNDIVSEIAVVRRIVDRLTARQEQMAEVITTLQFTAQNIIEGLSSPPQSTTVHVPQRQNVQRNRAVGRCAAIRPSTHPGPAGATTVAAKLNPSPPMPICCRASHEKADSYRCFVCSPLKRCEADSTGGSDRVFGRHLYCPIPIGDLK